MGDTALIDPVAVPPSERIQSMKKAFLAMTLAAMLLLVPASQATASTFNPTGEFAQFGECPLEDPKLLICLHSESSDGFFTVGKKEVPLVNPVVLQGGLSGVDVFAPLSGIAAANGETLSKTPQPVPGGLTGVVAPKWWPKWLQDWFNNHINEGFTGVTATVELAGPASDIKVNTLALLTETGTALSLPVKIKMSNPLLGSNCYIGSDSNPVVIDFTSGETSPPPPNEPISGSAGTFETNGAGTLITLSGGALVNNSFAAPEADGCGGIFSFFIDPLVNSLVGLPAPAGTNTAVLEGVIKNADPAAVKASE